VDLAPRHVLRTLTVEPMGKENLLEDGTQSKEAERWLGTHPTSYWIEQAQKALECLVLDVNQSQQRREREGIVPTSDLNYELLLVHIFRLLFLWIAEQEGVWPKPSSVPTFLSISRWAEKLRGKDSSESGQAWQEFQQICTQFYATSSSRDSYSGGTHELFCMGKPWELQSKAPIEQGHQQIFSDKALAKVVCILFENHDPSLKSLRLGLSQIGSMYEVLMEYRLLQAPSVGIRCKGVRNWIFVRELLGIDEPTCARNFQSYGVSKPKAKLWAKTIQTARKTEEVIQILPLDTEFPVVDKGQWLLSAGSERSRTSSHYTPAALVKPVVEKALQPWLLLWKQEPTSEQILALRVCDPAMGCGAFLFEVWQQLSDLLYQTWQKEKWEENDGFTKKYAQLQVATHCLFGVDKNPLALSLAKMTWWLACSLGSNPDLITEGKCHFFVGDALVGLVDSQLRMLHWKSDGASDVGKPLWKAFLSAYQQGATELQPEMVANLVLWAFFSPSKEKDREKALSQARCWLQASLLGDREASKQIAAKHDWVCQQLNPFHWALRFPHAQKNPKIEVESVSDTENNGYSMVIGNPPFLGGKRISTVHGDGYAQWLGAIHQCSKNVDLAAHFLIRAAGLVAEGVVGLVATNTIAQGATRRFGLQRLVGEQGWKIVDAVANQTWPGDATVSITTIHLVRGRRLAKDFRPKLDGISVPAIDSLLQAHQERDDPVRLVGNQGKAFIGCFLRGEGFVLPQASGERLVEVNPVNGTVICPFLGGEEVNVHPEQHYHRMAVFFGDRTLAEAETYPEAFAIVKQRVQPQRARLRSHGIDALHKQKWWRFANTRPEMRKAIAPLHRCLVTPRVSKHLNFCFLPTNWIFSDQLVVFAFQDYAHFAVLQSFIHECWVRLLSSTLGNGLRYTPSTCFETFPFPPDSEMNEQGDVSMFGKELYEQRAAWLKSKNIGLTKFYNTLQPSTTQQADDQSWRDLHLQLDRIVAIAYGWPDIAQRLNHRFTDQNRELAPLIIDRLWELNQQQSRDG
jgi:hypothetical protein